MNDETMNAAIEQAMRDAVAEFVRAVWGNGEPPAFMPGVVRRGLEAARPHLPETKALERVRALCDEWVLHQHAFKPPGQLSLDAAYAARKLRSAIGASHDE